MAEPRFSSVTGAHVDDDLPRTLRREREAQARRALDDTAEAAGPVSRGEPAGAGYDEAQYDYDDGDAPPATVTRLDIPFFHMMLFFLKAVVAAIPALIVLVGILWLFGEIITATFPELIQMQVLIRMPN